MPVKLNLNPQHPATLELGALCKDYRLRQREPQSEKYPDITKAFKLNEIIHGSQSRTYRLQPGAAAAEEAVDLYQWMRQNYPAVLGVLIHLVDAGADSIEVEINALHPDVSIYHSNHRILSLIPRVLSFFRGSLQPTQSRSRARPPFM